MSMVREKRVERRHDKDQILKQSVINLFMQCHDGLAFNFRVVVSLYVFRVAAIFFFPKLSFIVHNDYCTKNDLKLLRGFISTNHVSICELFSFLFE
jgi:hypothetical protein